MSRYISLTTVITSSVLYLIIIVYIIICHHVLYLLSISFLLSITLYFYALYDVLCRSTSVIIVLISLYLSLSLVIVHAGMFGVFHSDLLFMSLLFDNLSICIPSDICLFVESLWNVPVTSILKFTFLPSCTILQCCISIDFGSLQWYFCRCSFPLVYAL